MRIQHNIMALNAYRNYSNNTSALSGNLEKLSSGYKINRAGDDAAGLAISEKMRAQITGLDAAQKNVKDGVSLVKTAEGAMQEIQDMLNRMDSLATQSANGTYDNEVDRANLQKEVDALKTEINRIADSANFNGIKLLDGSLAKTDAVAGGTTTTTEEISGMDRIISSVISDGEKANQVAGNKTILDSVPGGPATKAKFTIDLSTITLSVKGTSVNGANASVANAILKINIGGTEITSATGTGVNSAAGIAMGGAASKVSASAMATSLLNGMKVANQGTQYAKATSPVVTINGVEWSVKASGGKLTFTQREIPETQDEAKANFDVEISVQKTNGSQKFEITLPEQASSKATGTVSEWDSIRVGTHVETAGVPQEDTNRANTVFRITEDDIQDGTKIAIGTRSFVLSIGQDSAVKLNAAGTKDTSGNEVLKLGKNDDLNTALCKLSQQIGSTVNFKIWNPKTNTATTVSFKIGVSDGSLGFPTGLAVVRASAVVSTASGAAGLGFDSLEKLAVNFKMEVNKTTVTEAKDAGTGLTLQIGDTSDKFNQMNVFVGDMHTNAMGTGKTTLDGEEVEVTDTIADIDISTQEGAATAVAVIKNAINYVSSVRGDLGAVQNRLEHTANNLSVMSENIQDAESTIRDTDVAEEMMSYVKNNILVQSAQAMLAQANQVPQGVLQLLG